MKVDRFKVRHPDAQEVSERRLHAGEEGRRRKTGRGGQGQKTTIRFLVLALRASPDTFRCSFQFKRQTRGTLDEERSPRGRVREERSAKEGKTKKNSEGKA